MKRGRSVAVVVLVVGQLFVPALVAARNVRQPVASTALAAPTLDSPAAGLRALLGRLLSEHAFLAMEEMRAIATERPDAEAAGDAVAANTGDLTAAIGSVYGDAAGAQFGEMWGRHVAGLEAYAQAVQAGDDAALDAAHDDLEKERQEFSDWLAAANPFVTSDAVNDLLHLHIDQLTSFVEQDFDAAFVTEQQAIDHMFETGDTLASAIISQFPDRFPGRGEGFSPAVSLWLALDRLLGEHLILAAEAMRAGQSEAEEFAAAGRALDNNSANLAASIESIYGKEAADAFGSLWNEHIAAYLAYIEAIRDADEEAQAEHRAVLEGYADRFGAFMAGANPNLEAGAASALIHHHTVALLEQVDAYSDGNYERAYETVREAYSHMFDVGKALAIALSEQFPARFPALPASSTEPEAAGGAAVRLLPLFLLLIACVSWLLAGGRARLVGGGHTRLAHVRTRRIRER